MTRRRCGWTPHGRLPAIAASTRPMRSATRSWTHERRVVVKAEHLGDKANPRFVVTTVDEPDPRTVYQKLYCPRGQAENAIKNFKRALCGDRLSCTTYLANAFRLALHAIA